MMNGYNGSDTCIYRDYINVFKVLLLVELLVTSSKVLHSSPPHWDMLVHLCRNIHAHIFSLCIFQNFASIGQMGYCLKIVLHYLCQYINNIYAHFVQKCLTSNNI